MFTKTKLTWGDADELARFLNWMHAQHWSLSSQGYQRKPAVVKTVVARELMREESRCSRVGTFVLKSDNTIIACVQVDERDDDGRVAVMSAAETAPRFQRRGTFWRQLAIPVIRVLCASSFDRIEAVTWTLNRKGIPVYKRFGFRAVPGSSLLMENHLPMIARYCAVKDYFAATDLLFGLTTTRSYGYDEVMHAGVGVFVYEWSGPSGELRVLVDWRRREIVTIDIDHQGQPTS